MRVAQHVTPRRPAPAADMGADDAKRREEDDWRIERAAERAAELAADKTLQRFGMLIGVNPSSDASVDRFRSNMGWIDEKRTRERQSAEAIRKGVVEKVMTGLGVVVLAGLCAVIATIATRGHL